MFNRLSIRASCLALFAILLPRVHAQCLDWHTFPRVGPEVAGNVRALIEFDDGTGTALYMGGLMTLPNSSSPATPYGVVKWDGHNLIPVGTLPSGTVTVLSVFDDGGGAALHALASGQQYSSNPSTVAKWNGSSWQSVGVLDGRCIAMTVHNDGTGPALCVAGEFDQVNSVVVPGVARWNGSSWSPIGGGPFGPNASHPYSIVSVPESTGPALYVGGSFYGLPTTSPNIAKWDGAAWSGVGGGLNSYALSMAAFDDGNGTALYVATVGYNPGQSILRWDGLHWTGVAGPGLDVPDVLKVLDDGGGPQLWVGARNYSPPYDAKIQHFDGSTWSTITPNPGTQNCSEVQGVIFALAFFDEGNGRRLFAGTSPGSVGLPSNIVARHDVNAWSRLGPPLQGFSATMLASAVHDDGSGPSLYVGGPNLCIADETSVWGVARWTGSSWAQVGSEFYSCRALTTCDFGQGPLLMAGSGNILWKLSNGAWTNVGQAPFTNDAILALKQFAGNVYIGGSFSYIGGAASSNLARWNPTLGFTTVGTPPHAGALGDVNALETFDDGHGLGLYAAGSFTLAGTVAAAHIVRFDGTNWTALGSGTNALVDALTTFDDGTGDALYAAGTFTTAGGVPASCVAKWNGTTWSALGSGLNAQVLTLEVFDDGSGPALYAGGNFTASGSVPMERIAKWNGTTWSAVGGNIDGTVWTLKSFDDGTGLGAQLFAGGVFHHAGGLPSENFAAWRGCGSTAIAKFCFGDGSDGACPCGNAGLSARGCDNSAATGGARLNATGTASPDTIILHGAGELPNAPTLVFQGSVALSQPILFGDGMRCVGGNLKRLFTTNAVGGAMNVPDATQMSISARSAALGDPLLPGSVRSYQTWYRDPNLTFCAPPTGNAWNLSNAVRIVW